MAGILANLAGSLTSSDILGGKPLAPSSMPVQQLSMTGSPVPGYHPLTPFVQQMVMGLGQRLGQPQQAQSQDAAAAQEAQMQQAQQASIQAAKARMMQAYTSNRPSQVATPWRF